MSLGILRYKADALLLYFTDKQKLSGLPIWINFNTREKGRLLTQRLSEAAASYKSDETVSLVLLVVIPFSELLRIGSCVASSGVDVHGANGLQTCLGLHSYVGRVIRFIPLSWQDLARGKGMPTLLRLSSGLR